MCVAQEAEVADEYGLDALQGPELVVALLGQNMKIGGNVVGFNGRLLAVEDDVDEPVKVGQVVFVALQRARLAPPGLQEGKKGLHAVRKELGLQIHCHSSCFVCRLSIAACLFGT
ncbi:hypothetical protein SIC45_07445 [Marinococcus sp. PL1-022]|nr:hypothetical protein [Marinococcus sp. PL1-022]MDX6152810.1 hypothetical protein [Marinococcus sp. PL1-022]